MNDLKEKLTQFGQQHLLQFWDELDAQQKQSLQSQIEQIDFAQLSELKSQVGGDQVWSELAAKAKAPNAIRLDQEKPFTRQQARERGEQALSNGKVGLILVAGGQGTRLGFDAPKGMFPLGPISGRTLFQIHIEKAIALGNHYGKELPLFVMTSPATHEDTVNFLNENDRFGIKAENLHVFCQGTMPAVDMKTGQVILEEKGQLFTAPNGHGGAVSALEENGCLDELEKRNIEHVFYWQVDNPMVQVADPLTIGYHILCQSQLTSHACPKREPLHKVGNIVEIDGKVQIIEYSDLPDNVAHQTSSDGSLMLWAGNIAVHVFDVAFLRAMTTHADALPFHIAKKKVPFVDQTGETIEPDEPNAVKFERFIFDLLPMAENALVVEVDPNDAFSPLKNASGAPADTAETARAAMTNQARRWLSDCGVAVEDSVDVEISPLFALNPQLLKKRLGSETQTISESKYFS